jgi:hypothetical protein
MIHMEPDVYTETKTNKNLNSTTKHERTQQKHKRETASSQRCMEEETQIPSILLVAYPREMLRMTVSSTAENSSIYG